MALSLAGNISASCVAQLVAPGEVNLQFPGGFRISAQNGFEGGSPAEIVKSLMGQINSALVPLGPFFDILALLKAICDSVSAVPKAIAGNPFALAQAIANMIQALDKIIGLIPPLPIFALVHDILGVIITGIQAIKTRLQAMSVIRNRINAAISRGAALNNTQLIAIASCADSNFNIHLANLNEEFTPLNRIIGLVNGLLQLAGLPCIPTIGGVAGVDPASLAVLDAVVKVLTIAQNAIPVGGTIPLPALPASGTC